VVGRWLKEVNASNKPDPLTNESLQCRPAGPHFMQISELDHCSVLCEPREQSRRVFDDYFCTFAVLGSSMENEADAGLGVKVSCGEELSRAEAGRIPLDALLD